MGGTFEFVYLVYAPSRPGAQFKVGRTWNVKLRLSQLRRQVGGSVFLLGLIKRRGAYSAHKTEQSLHSALRQYEPGRGDWYDSPGSVFGAFFSTPGAVPMEVL